MRFVFRTSVVAAALLFQLVLAAPAAAQNFTLTIHMSGNVFGRVGTFPLAALCDVPAGGTMVCAYQVASGTAVRIAANAPGGVPGLFSGGTGPAAACGFSACSFTMTGTTDVNVNFNTGNGPVVTVTMALAGDGRGKVISDNSRCQNIDPIQGTACTTSYIQGTSVQLAAVPAPGARFFGYAASAGGAAACGTALTCAFTITGSATVTATFHAITSLAVSPATASKPVGGPSQTFAAMGTFTDGVTEPIPFGLGAWVTLTSLPTARFSLAAAADSTNVYAIGGIENNSPSATVTMYTPSTLTWTTRASMPTPREGVGVATIGGLIYAAGGNTTGSNPVTALERYDPATNIWSTLTPMPSPRRFLEAAAIGGKLYAVGGETLNGGISTTVATVEVYDPATNTWTTKASMLSARKQFGLVAIDGRLYAAGGAGTGGAGNSIEAYDPASNTWTARASIPAAFAATATAAADGVLYIMGGSTGQSSTYAYDPVANLWSRKDSMPTGRGELAAVALNGIVYAIGGLTGSTSTTTTTKVESLIDSLRWSSAQPGIAVIDQQLSRATGVTVGTTTISASIGSFLCGPCATFTSFSPFATDMSLDSPLNGSIVSAPFVISGWALNKGAPAGTGTGVDTVHVYAAPSSGPAVFVGVATYGGARSDVAATFGAQFTNSGFTLTGGGSLAPGAYTITAYARNALTGAFDATKSANIQIKAPVSNGLMNVDTPTSGATLTSAFEVGGWAIDMGAPSGTGVDAVQFYVFPNAGNAPGVFIGQGSFGGVRGDVGAAFGSRFTNSGYHFTITGLGPGQFVLGVYARSTVTGTYSIVRTQPFNVNATALMSIDSPRPEVAITLGSFVVAGWSIDRSVESSGPSGTGVDLLHVYAYPNPGSGQAPIFLGIASVGVHRPDVGALYGTRYDDSGYTLTVDRAAAGLTPGIYNIVVHSHSTVTGAFNNVALVQVTLQ